jgi:hypothetical protein
MPDYTPVALPGQTWTFSAGTAVVGGDLVEVTASNTVGKVGTLASTAFVGVANHDAGIGAKVTVTLSKAIHESLADGVIAAGAQLTTTNTASRHVKALAASAANVDVTGTPTEASIEAFNAAINTAVNQARGVIGVAITAATDNTLVRWAQK